MSDVEKLEAELAEARRKEARGRRSPQTPPLSERSVPEQPRVTLPAPQADQPKVMAPAQAGAAPASTAADALPAEWPYAGYSGPQPWEVKHPPTVTHDRGFVTSGSAGELVVELAACLARLGYATKLSMGANPHAIYGQSEAEAVRAFCAAYGVAEEPSIVKATTPSVVGVWIWEALFRAVRSAEEAQG